MRYPTPLEIRNRPVVVGHPARRLYRCWRGGGFPACEENREVSSAVDLARPFARDGDDELLDLLSEPGLPVEVVEDEVAARGEQLEGAPHRLEREEIVLQAQLRHRAHLHERIR